MKQLSLLLFLTVMLSVLSLSHAATRHVEKWGSDDNAPKCTKSLPCLTLQAVLTVSGKNDRIIVGPGTYEEDGLFIEHIGLRLESIAGRHATTIQSNNGNHALGVSAEKVRIGKKGKGFTFLGGSNPDQAGIHIFISDPGEFSSIRIEGNQFGLPRMVDEAPNAGHRNYYGIWVQSGGGKIQIRHNLFVNNDEYGLYCSLCPRALIRENRVEGNGQTGMIVWGANGTAISDNLIVVNANRGLNLRNSGDSQLKIKSNVADSNDLVGIDVNAEQGGIQIVGNIASHSGDGIQIRADFGINPSTVRKNLVVDNDVGFDVFRTTNIRLEKNIATGNVDRGFRLSESDEVTLFRNNAVIEGACGIEARDNDYTVDSLFSANNSVVTCEFSGGSVTLTGPSPSKPPALGIRKAARLVGG